jgi:hypothetical protein
VENNPGDAGELVRERNRHHVRMSARLELIEPMAETMSISAEVQ